MLTYKYIGSAVPVEVRQALEALIQSNRLKHADNFRFSPRDDEEGLKQFEALAVRGCGSLFEREVVDHTDRKWLVGCNYNQ